MIVNTYRIDCFWILEWLELAIIIWSKYISTGTLSTVCVRSVVLIQDFKWIVDALSSIWLFTSLVFESARIGIENEWISVWNVDTRCLTECVALVFLNKLNSVNVIPQLLQSRNKLEVMSRESLKLSLEI